MEGCGESVKIPMRVWTNRPLHGNNLVNWSRIWAAGSVAILYSLPHLESLWEVQMAMKSYLFNP